MDTRDKYVVGAIAVGGVGLLLFALCRRSRRGRSNALGSVRDVNEAKKELLKLLSDDDPESWAVARDLALDYGLLKTGKVIEVKPRATSAYYVWRVKIDDKWFGSYHDEFKVDQFVDYVTSDRVVVPIPELPEARLARVWFGAHIFPPLMIKKWINRWWPDDGSEPLAGLRRRRKQPKRVTLNDVYEDWQTFNNLIRDPDPAAMDVAEDFALERGLKLADGGKRNEGGFTISPYGSPDAPITRVSWSQKGENANIFVDFNRHATSSLYAELDKLSPDAEDDEVERVMAEFVREGGVKVRGHHIERGWYADPDRASAVSDMNKMLARRAWGVAKRLKQMSSNTSLKDLEYAISDALIAHRSPYNSSLPDDLFGLSRSRSQRHAR